MARGVDGADGFTTLRAALGLTERRRPGRHACGSPTTTIDGVVDYLHRNFVGLRTEDALYRFFGRNAFGAPVGMSVHHFGDDVDAEQAGAAWTEWIARVY